MAIVIDENDNVIQVVSGANQQITVVTGSPTLIDVAYSVIVVTGNEPRPNANLVIWICTNNTIPVNAIDTDLVATPSAVDNADTTAPSSPTGLTASNITSTSFTLSWAASTDNVAVTSYDIEINGTIYSSTSGTTVNITGLTANTNYSVRVRANDEVNNHSSWATLTGGVTTTGSAIFIDDFNRADGNANNNWVSPGTLTIVSNALHMTGWAGFARAAQPSMPKTVSVRATFAGNVTAYQGIFLGYSTTTGSGIKLFNLGGTWVVGDADSAFAFNTTCTTQPSGSVTSLRLDFDGTTVTAYANNSIIHTATLAALNIGLDSNSANIYQIGYCGEAKTADIDLIEVWAA